MFIWIYRLAILPFALLLLPRYLLHIKRRGGYGERFGTRFGWGITVPAKTPGKRRIWIQAVSLGEMLAIEPLLKGLRADSRNELYLTATTSTGFALAREKYGSFAVGISYFPLDFWFCSRIAWNRIDPDLAICAETELWPEHMQQAHRRGVPFVLVNARLSDRSFSKTLRVARWAESTMRQISEVMASSDQDRQRYLDLGLRPDQTSVTGNIKVDVAIEPILKAEERVAMRRSLGLGQGFVLLGSSTWPGEEAMLLQTWRAIRAEQPDARLLIVPRHAERRGEIEVLLLEEGRDLRWHFKSRGASPGDVDVLVADTHGELRALTQIADLAFVGKSLPPHREGQTPVECGALGVPMVFGSGMANFRSIRAGLLDYGAAREVADAAEARKILLKLSREPASRAAMGEAGRRWHAASKGAVDKTLARVAYWLEQGSS